MSDLAWSDDRVTTLSKLWLDGLSAAQIAKQLGGVTRNAVIGKVHRLGLGGRAVPSRPTKPAKVRSARPAAPVRRRLEPRPVSPTPAPSMEGPGLITSMTALGAHTCKWPIGDPKADDFSFCGRLAHGPYCPSHRAQGVRAGAAWRADRDLVVRRALAGLV